MKKASKKHMPIDYALASPRLELAGRECIVDGMQSVIEYCDTKIAISLGSQIIIFRGFDLKISSFTREGAIVEGSICSMEFVGC